MGRVRSSIPRTRLPLHRRLLADPAAARRWLVVIALATATAGLTCRFLAGAETSRRSWGHTRTVLVVDRAVETGEPLAGAVTAARWPVALAPDGVVADLPDGARASGPLGPGSPVTDAVVADSLPGGDGRRRVAVPVGATRLPLEPGDRVDVWASIDPSLAGGELATRRVATDATVTSTGEATVVVAVDPDEVAPVAEATALATVTLVGTS